MNRAQCNDYRRECCACLSAWNDCTCAGGPEPLPEGSFALAMEDIRIAFSDLGFVAAWALSPILDAINNMTGSEE